MSHQLHYRACNLCEAICGLEIEYQGQEIMAIRGDKNDPFSRGHICPKAVALKDIYEDPNRLKLPLKKTNEGWQSIAWEQAFDEITQKIKAIQAQHGSSAVAMYAGNPSVHNSGTFLAGTDLMRALKTKNIFSATSADQLPHHFASWQMFGHPMLLPIPDIDRTDYWLIMGGNPIASNGSIMTAPDVANRLKAIQQRGGKVVVIDPRFTETAAKADAHHFIVPGTDAFLLLAMLHVVFAEGLEKMPDYAVGVETLKEIVADFSPELVEKQTGIAAKTIRHLVREFTAAPSAVVYGRVGLSTQAFGGVCQWLLNAFNVVTGNLDREGGAMFTHPAVDFLMTQKGIYNKYNRHQSRVRGLPEFMGELPVSVLAEEILTEGDGQIKALVTSCGNPVLSTPNGRQLDEALETLELMVCVDIYLNETTRHAHYILPPATGLEVAHYDLTFNALSVRNVTRFSEPLFEKSAGAKFDWEIFQALTARLVGDYTADFVPQDPHSKVDVGLRFGTYKMTLDTLRQARHGMDLGPLRPAFPERLLTANKTVELAPSLLTGDMARVREALQSTQTADEFDLLLINRRHLRDNNSWMHNAERLVKGRNRCTLLMHPRDAAQRGIKSNDTVQIRSRVGQVAVPVEITEDMMEGVVCLPHGYGHDRTGVRLPVAQAHAGVSVNDLTDDLLLDSLTGNAVFGGVPVRVAFS
ncbi:MAG: molybdopterin-dependent oxidoreductase [Spirosomaceae bacterium]|jgi:anaerobic selenocysteine-containing dehydrogenase|nr:molybdopterin-dependent oxidoreductase [Spirosomataceae bacterium]